MHFPLLSKPRLGEFNSQQISHRFHVDVPLEAGRGLGPLRGAVDAHPVPDVVGVLAARDAGSSAGQH